MLYQTRQSKTKRLPPLSSSSPSIPGPIETGSSDGGESGAGEHLTRLLELCQCENVLLVVFRWYGGVQMGGQRWRCISVVAREALEEGGFIGTRTSIDVHARQSHSNRGKGQKDKHKKK